MVMYMLYTIALEPKIFTNFVTYIHWQRFFLCLCDVYQYT